jgi:hypothetical protein
MPNLFGNLYFNNYSFNRDRGMSHDEVCRAMKAGGGYVSDKELESFKLKYEERVA